MTVSIWQRKGGRDTECDVVVVGAGICGLSAAMHLQRRGLDVEVVERHTVGSGASGRNAGYLMRGAHDNYAAAVKAYGRDQAKALWLLTERNLRELRAQGVETLPGYSARPSCLLALTREELEQLKESRELLAQDGFTVDWLDSGDDSAWASGNALGALVNPDDAVCDSMEVLRLLASKLKRTPRGQQEVIGLEGVPGSVRVETSGGVIRAQHALVCTNAYLPLALPELEGAIAPKRAQMLAARTSARLDMANYANHGSEYFRAYSPGVILLGGCRTYHAEEEVGYEDRTTPAVQDHLEQFARGTLGILDIEVVARWAGTMGFTPDSLPMIGPSHANPGVWFCGGFTGHGMSMGFETARVAVEAMLAGTPRLFDAARVRSTQQPDV